MRLQTTESQWKKADFHSFSAIFFGFSRFLAVFAGFYTCEGAIYRHFVAALRTFPLRSV
jgi:hypothetical protein